ncbi:MAG: hypothetical protein JWN38_13 [Candidatus Saccharibacteria bacterium]|nr:hypothetical protein [Candidatus Saccharibacteria bacterium]
MQRNTAKFYGFLVLVLGLAGLVAGEKQLFGFLNIDIALDVARLLFAAVLLYVGYAAKTMKPVRASLLAIGVVYVVLGVAGLFSADVGGLLPDKLSVFDKVFHLVAGVLAIGVGAKSADQGQPAHATA